ncbi:MAG: MerR family transcriptional regulator [Bacteriovoracaceae bacterium]|jgi:DNA-binding transcriptional MerR regulator|nr:hypothetical protein [Halobacteriovoraceae bacterium]MDP7321174.1 MerR family transcriptional regulator [Bacteriovoracaceae bacterium]
MNGHNIQVVSKLTGISIHTLRAWERRYSVVTPKRLANGRRSFSKAEVDKLKLVSELTKLGFPISEVAYLKESELKNKVDELNFDTKKINAGTKYTQEQMQQTVGHLILALEGYKLDIISHELSKLSRQTNARSLVFDVLIPLLKKISEKVHLGELSIAQEHAITSLLRFHLGRFIYQDTKVNLNPSKKIVFATVEGDLHEFGIILASILAAYYNISFYMLGPNLPVLSLVEATMALNADTVIIGTTDFKGGPTVQALNEYFSTLIESLPQEKQIIIGGTGKFDYNLFQSTARMSYISKLEELDVFFRKASSLSS